MQSENCFVVCSPRVKPINSVQIGIIEGKCGFFDRCEITDDMLPPLRGTGEEKTIHIVSHPGLRKSSKNYNRMLSRHKKMLCRDACQYLLGLAVIVHTLPKLNPQPPNYDQQIGIIGIDPDHPICEQQEVGDLSLIVRVEEDAGVGGGFFCQYLTIVSSGDVEKMNWMRCWMRWMILTEDLAT